MWFYFLLGTIIIGMGLLVHKGKAYFLISGYNTYSKEKKKNVNVEAIARYMGLYSYLNGFIAYLAGILTALDVKNLMAPVIVFFVVSTVVLLVKIQKYDGNMFDKDGRLKKDGKKQLVIVGIITGITVIFVGAVMFFSTRPTTVVQYEDSFEIKGMYGEEVPYEEIVTVELLEHLPAITMRTNGSAVGPKLRGHFNTREYGAVKLFLDKSRPPYIYIETTKRRIVMNLQDKGKTSDFYEFLKSKVE